MKGGRDYTDYTNYTDYTPYTRYTANLEKSTGIEIPARLIRKIYKRTRPVMQAQACIPSEYGGQGRQIAGFCIKKSEPIISDELACSTYCQC